MKNRALLGFLCLAVMAGWGLAGDVVPVAVSPGVENGRALVRQGCPTFSWTAVSWAVSYKVAVFEAAGGEAPDYETIAAAASPVLVKEIPGQAFSWTPSADESLPAGGSYVWYVGAMVNAAQGTWSEGRMFAVAADGPVWGVVSEPGESGIGDRSAGNGLPAGNFELTAAAKENFDLAGDSRSGVQASQGTYNTYYGLSAGASVTTGVNNSFFGRFAGYADLVGNDNTFMGHQAGRSCIGDENTFIGSMAGYSNAEGYRNAFLGYSAGRKNVDGCDNAFFGVRAGYNNTGDYNVFVGLDAGYSNTSAEYNTFIGWYSGKSTTTGSENTFIGNMAGYSNVTGERNVFIGNEAGYNETGSAKLYISNTISDPPLIYGDFILKRVGINNKNPGAVFVVGTGGAYCNGTTWVDGSSRDYKENIESLTSEEALAAFDGLEPVKFNYREVKDEACLGFIAEDVPDLVATNDRKGLTAMDMVALLTKVVQEQRKAITTLQEKIAKLEQKDLKEN